MLFPAFQANPGDTAMSVAATGRARPGHLVLLGMGPAHLHVLRAFAQGPWPKVRLTVVTPAATLIYPPLVPDLVAGRCTLEACTLPLQALLARGHAEHRVSSIGSLDAAARRLTLSSGEVLDYDLLSLDIHPAIHREAIEAAMPGARTHALFFRPVEVFMSLWGQLAALHPERALHLAVVGGGLDAVALAMACQHGLKHLTQRPAGSRVSLVTGGALPGAGETPALQQRIWRALKQRGITVLPERCTGFSAGEVQLAHGGRLRCDAPVLAPATQTPPWLRDSGLALDEHGGLALQPSLQSRSHAEVFAVDATASAASGRALAAALRAAAAGQPPPPAPSPRTRLTLLSCGDGRALGAWGGLGFEGRWVWALKQWQDLRAIQA